MPEALAAVTAPFFLNTGFNDAIFSNFVSGRGCSSVSITLSPFLDFIVIGAISCENMFFSFALPHAV